MQRLRITFGKTAQMRYTGHLDVYRAWERLMRRAGLPLAYTQGFSPHPRLNLASALPLGFTGDAEVIDVWLERELEIDAGLLALRQATPPGIEICSIQPIDERAPTLQTILQASEFLITFFDNIPDLEQRVLLLWQANSLPRERRGKTYDLRPLIQTIEVISTPNQEKRQLCTRLVAREGATGRPEEVVAAMGLDPLQARYHRTQLIWQ